MVARNNPTVSHLKNVLDKAEDGSVALPVTIASSTSGPINKNPTIGRIEQALVVAEDGSMALPVEVVKLSEDGSTFERVTEFGDGGGGGGGGGTSEPVTWSDVQNKPATFPPTAHNHDERYYTKPEIDSAGYLLAQPDGQTVEVHGGELRARALTGLQLGVNQLNTWLAGTEKNIQEQLDEMKMRLAALISGIDYLGKFETKAELDAFANTKIDELKNGDLAIVLADETENGARVMRFWNARLGYWEFGGPLSFIDAFIALSDTPNAYDNGKYLRSNINGLYFDTIRYNDIEGKPSSTVAQIDDAVTKRHEHANKDRLDKINEGAGGVLTYNGEQYVRVSDLPAPQAKQRLFAYRSGGDQTLTAGTDCVFNTKHSGDIPYDTETGIFTLEAGKLYRVEVSGSLYTSGWVILQLVNAETNVIVNAISRGIWMDANPSNSNWHESSAGPLKTYITPAATRGYKIRATSMSGESSLRSGYTSLEIQEV